MPRIPTGLCRFLRLRERPTPAATVNSLRYKVSQPAVPPPCHTPLDAPGGGPRVGRWAAAASAVGLGLLTATELHKQYGRGGESTKFSWMTHEAILSRRTRLVTLESYLQNQLHTKTTWLDATHATLVGPNMEGAINLEGNWVHLTFQVHGHLRVLGPRICGKIHQQFCCAMAEIPPPIL